MKLVKTSPFGHSHLYVLKSVNDQYPGPVIHWNAVMPQAKFYGITIQNQSILVNAIFQ